MEEVKIYIRGKLLCLWEGNYYQTLCVRGRKSEVERERERERCLKRVFEETVLTNKIPFGLPYSILRPMDLLFPLSECSCELKGLLQETSTGSIKEEGLQENKLTRLIILIFRQFFSLYRPIFSVDRYFARKKRWLSSKYLIHHRIRIISIEFFLWQCFLDFFSSLDNLTCLFKSSYPVFLKW